ncbi:GmrSD restriction endonuclease domain-containing protein [Aromatoleum tolulyticum]|uniref:GmrSD restriction endonuclease domain-containing protein n=1 Tax=Aromatoleum tolulyticum TaxID=34027 RepID=UPI0011158195|nr:DUF1524 domain-containing protein [Aromatoleum tolulyticum]
MIFEYPVPSIAELKDYITNGNQGGALQKALALPMLAGARNDIFDPSVSLCYPSTEPIELHHIYPKNWCRNNRTGDLATILDSQRAGRDFVNSIANLMPLSRTSNNAWKDANPGQFIETKRLSFSALRTALKPVFIDEECFRLLSSGSQGIAGFWGRRSMLIASDLVNRATVSF